MTVERTRGDLLAADVEALVNAVNCVGVMGRGIAAQFKRAYPDCFRSYASACERGDLVPGRMHVYATKGESNPRYIINFPTKRHWRETSRLTDIEIGLSALAEEVHKHEIRSIAIPALGCGLGGLDWNAVGSRIEATFANLAGVHVLLFEPAEVG